MPDLLESWRNALDTLTLNSDVSTSAVDSLRASTSTGHQWYAVNHPRPTFCNYCREKLSGVPWHGLGCEVCKVKAHKRCAEKIRDPCKWTVEGSIPPQLQYVNPENTLVPHQFIEGNLPMSSKCTVCEKVCGSVLKLQDWRCLWCAACVHDGCVGQLARGCSLGMTNLSVLPPIAVRSVDNKGVATNVFTEATACLTEDATHSNCGAVHCDGAALLIDTNVLRPEAFGGECGGGSPLLVLVNSKSGDNQGQRMIRKFRRLLNPIQVFDIISTGPEFALNFFSTFDSFRVLVCGGDGTVGWVLSTCDQLNMHSKCQLAVLPLGTGNDLARVLGWGHAFYDDTQLPNLVRTFERAHTRMLDRWSVSVVEGAFTEAVRECEAEITQRVTAVLEAEQPAEVIAATRALCNTVRDLMERVAETYGQVEAWETQAGNPPEDPISQKCAVLLAKLDVLMKNLGDSPAGVAESGFEPEESESNRESEEERNRRDSLVGRANSLKKALRDMMDVAEKSIDAHNKSSKASSKRERFRKKRSKTTPSALKVSSSNLSSSSATSPPPSPSPLLADRLGIRSGHGGRSSEEGHTSGLGNSPERSSLPANSPFTTVEVCGADGRPLSTSSRSGTGAWPNAPNLSPCIGVQPPTPASTREPSAVSSCEEEGTGTTTDTNGFNVPDRPCVDFVPREKRPDRLFKPRSECDIHLQSTDIKLSHSDSSLCDHAAGTSSCGNRSLITTGGGGHWSKVKEKRKQSAGYAHNHLSRCGLSGGSLIAELLLLNAKVLGVSNSGAPVYSLDQCKELKVMNNYFGIGLDAKIALDFHNKREEGPEKTRSRSKLFMWYGMLGGKELVHRTYRNLHQRIRLECDGVEIDLPSLQGIVILNIPSYSGGANFWGSGRDDSFQAQSYDDKLLEVVALFGVIHVATSRVPNVVRLQNHRIAQCRHVRITISGDEPIPVQVDGEPWLQPPGIIQITHKNRAQLLVRNPAFEATLKKWDEQKEKSTAPSTPTALADEAPFNRQAQELVQLVESEMATLGVSSTFLEALEHAATAIRKADEMPDDGDDMLSVREEALAGVEVVVDLLEDHFGFPLPRSPQHGQPAGSGVPQFTFDTKGDEPDRWRYVINRMRQALCREDAAIKEERKHSSDPDARKRSRLTTWLRNKWRRRRAPRSDVSTWGVDEVTCWLASLSLSCYADQFKSNDISGCELVHLERSDFKDLGVSKIGHIKRLQSAIVDLVEKEDEHRGRAGRKGASLSVERRGSISVGTQELPSMSSL